MSIYKREIIHEIPFLSERGNNMPELKSKEEYEKWKAERAIDIQNGKYKPQSKPKITAKIILHNFINMLKIPQLSFFIADMNKLKKFILANRSASLVLTFYFLVIVFILLQGTDYQPTQSTTGNYMVENSAWDASVPAVTDYLKSNLKDPDSFQAIEWSPVKKIESGGYMVRCKYRAKNSFGGYVVENKVFIMTTDGAITSAVDWH